MAQEKFMPEGVSAAKGQFRYPEPGFRADNITLKEWKPSGDTNLSDHVIKMKLKTEPTELIRFVGDCFSLKYKVRYANPAYKVDGATDEVKAAKHWVQASERKPGIFLDPTLGPAAFFSKIDVRIQETRLDAHRLEEFGFLYQSINRRFTTAAAQRSRYGKVFPRVNTTSKRVFATAQLLSPEMKDVVTKSLQFDSWNETMSMTVSFGMDGVFPFSNQSGILAAMMNKIIPQGFLRPSTEIYVDLYKRSPNDAAIDSWRMKDGSYFDGEAPDYVNPLMDVIVEDLSIIYESLTPAPWLLPSLTKGAKSYYCDVPRLNHKGVPGGVRYSEINMPIEAGTKAIIVFWAPENQIVYNPTSRVNLHTRFAYPANCSEIRVKLTGKDHFLLHQGLVNPGRQEACLEPGNQAYHWSLCKQGLYDDVLDSFFPRSNGVKAYDQILLLNCCHFKIEKPIDLIVTTLFTAAGSPANYRMVVITLQQYLFTQNADLLWKYEVQI